MSFLTANFSLEELTASPTALSKGIDNTPDEHILANLKLLAHKLEFIRVLVGKPVNISSGYRCPALNKAVGGAKDSAHVLGLAADINVDGYTPKQLGQLVKASGLEVDQVIQEFPDRANGGWLHIGLSEGVLRHQFLTIKTGTGYMQGLV